MTKEKLELYKELQPYFPNDWQTGDMYYCSECGVRSFIQERYRTTFPANYVELLPCCPKFALRLPLPIDPVNPGRGLIEMIKADGKFLCLNEGQEKWRFSITNDGEEVKYYYGITPTLALLRTLKAQMEGKK